MPRTPEKPYVRFLFGHNRGVYINAAAAVCLGERVEVYRIGDQLALAAADGGSGYLFKKSGSSSRTVNNSFFCAYLRQKYPDATDGKLPAAVDTARHAVFFPATGLEDAPPLERFHRLDFSGVTQYTPLPPDAEQVAVPTYLPKSSTALWNGNVLALIPAPDGALIRRFSSERGRYYLQSEALGAWCGEHWNEGVVYCRKAGDAWLLSTDLVSLMETENTDGFTELPVESTARLCQYYARPASMQRGIFFSQEIRKHLRKCVDVYEHVDGGVLALVNRNSEKRTDQTAAVAENGQFVYSTMLRYLVEQTYMDEKWGDRVPAVYDGKADAVLLGEVGPDTVFSTDDYRPLPIKTVRQFYCEISPHELVIKKIQIPGRCAILANGSALAFQQRRVGAYILEDRSGGMILRDQKVLAFARREWKDRPLFIRTVDKAAIVSPELHSLLDWRGLEEFHPLSVESHMTAAIGRYFDVRLAPDAAAALGGRASVYSYGAWLALAADGQGDVEIQPAEYGGHVLSHSPR